MDGVRLFASKPVQVVLALAYAFLAIWLIPKTDAMAPLILIALGIPLIFRLVPRNWLYGTRTWRTLRGPEDHWYRQNVISGVVMVIAGAIWFVVAR